MAYNYERLANFSCGWAPVKMKDGSGFSFVSKLGDLMPYRFCEIEEFVDGFALVGLFDAKDERKYTYVSQDENLCPIRFTDISTFKGNYGKAWIGKEEYTIDRKFNVYQFKNTLLDKIKPTENEDMPDILINNSMTGQVKKLDLIFKLCGPKIEGMIPILMKDGSGFTFIDENFNIMPQRFSAPARFKGGSANVVLTDGSLGTVDKEGNFTLLGDKAPQELKDQKDRVARVNELVDQLEAELGIKHDEFGTPFYKQFCSSQKFADKVLLEYLRLTSEEEKEKFVKKYQATERDLEILDQAIASVLGDIISRREEDPEDDDENDNI